MAILPSLASYTSPPINLLALPSSLHVLHTPSYAPPAILSRLALRLTPQVENHAGSGEETERSLSLLEISSQVGLPIGLTKELMESIEQLSAPEGLREPVGLVRDDQAVGDGGVRWYRDIISGWEL
jgi:ESCRT-II complex subunit VPS36